ncbi:MAG: hypothetical protein ACHRHE_19035 [Tepidisphaerales bacterium]
MDAVVFCGIQGSGKSFRWRAEDAHRNALSAHCYWLLRRHGRSATAATRHLQGMGVAEKNELLFQNGINYNDLPAWQKRGIGVYWEQFGKQAMNRKTGEPVTAIRRRLKNDLELPVGREYDTMILQLLRAARRVSAERR